MRKLNHKLENNSYDSSADLHCLPDAPLSTVKLRSVEKPLRGQSTINKYLEVKKGESNPQE